MTKPLLDLRRLWRDLRLAPEPVPYGLGDWWGERGDADLRESLGFFRMESLAKHECLFLLGRPGAGKSAEITRLASGEVAGFSDECLVVIPCKEIGADVDVELQRKPKWRAALRQDKPVRLVLDALDEGFLRDSNYFSRLKYALENLRSLHPELRLLLACRPAEWDATFEESVHAIWHGRGKPAVYALEMLSRQNQLALVKHWGVSDADQFIAWVRRTHFEEFAAWPRSLEWLTEQFHAGGAGEITYTELCQRRVMRGFGEDRRIEEADRADRVATWAHALMLIAATLAFCGKRGITLDRDDPACLTLDEMFHGRASLEMPGEPPLVRENVREAVRKASHLLELHDGYHRFQNQSDLEYLAAAMLASLDVEQLAELFGCPDEGGRWRVFPQLTATAANLAAQSRDFFARVLERDPRVLMRMDFASKRPEARREAVDAILAATAGAGSTDEHDQHAHFSTLRHPGIEEQLRPWLFDQKQSREVRHLAFDIAFACCGIQFWEELDRIATRGDDFLQSRLPSVLMRFGQSFSEQRLRELAVSPQDDLAGVAMNALLDQGWKAGDLAPLLRQSTEDAYNAYDLLLGRIARECDISDVPSLLASIGSWPMRISYDGDAPQLAEALIVKAVAALEHEEVCAALTKFLIGRFENCEWMFHDAHLRNLARFGLDAPERRRALLLALVNAWPSNLRVELSLFNAPVLPEDYPWLLDEVAKARGVAATLLAKLVGSVAWQLCDKHHEALDRAYAASAELRAQLPPADATGISATLRRLRSEAEEKQRARQEKFKSERNRPPYHHEQHLAQMLAACRAGRFGSWTSLCFALSQPTSERDAADFFRCTDIRQLAGWQAGSDELRVELTQIARDFLLKIEIPPPVGSEIPGEFFGLVYALSLHASRLQIDSELRAAIRPVWIQALLRHCGSEDGPLAGPIAALTAAAPARIAEGCEREFRASWERNEIIFGSLLSAAWSPETEAALVLVIETAPLQPESYRSGLNLLAERNLSCAKQIASRRLAEHVTEPDSPARRAAIAVCLFIFHDCWKDAWPHFAADLATARQLILECSRWLDSSEQEQRLMEMPLPLVAALHAVMLEVFPLKDSPNHGGGHFLGPIEEAYRLHDAFRRSLELRGAHDELKTIYARNDELREAWWISRSLQRARTRAHAQRRQPPSAAEFIRFLGTKGGVFVHDDDSLQLAVLASLRRFEKGLHPDGILLLWGKEGKKNVPRSEETLQVAVVQHLRREFEQREIVVNMETKIGGERSDIRVEAKSFSVTVEVKLGHSNDRLRPLRKSMRTQLRDAYLAKRNETHGIYLVGWFFCPAFRNEGLRDMKSIGAARKHFDAQAKRLSTNGYSLKALVVNCAWKESAAARMKRAKSVSSCRLND